MKFGYVIEIRGTGKFYQDSTLTPPGHVYDGPLRSAKVVSKAQAYELRYVEEIVRKVELFKNGKAKRVLKRRRSNNGLA